jgi:peroxygenase
MADTQFQQGTTGANVIAPPHKHHDDKTKQQRNILDREEEERARENTQNREKQQKQDAVQDKQKQVHVSKEKPLKEHVPAPKQVAEEKEIQGERHKGDEAFLQEPTTDGRDRESMSILQKHVEFFDRNKDGWIYPRETFEGLRAIGFGYILSFIGTFIIHVFLAMFATHSWIPSPFFGIDISMIHKCKHGSDANVYDKEGRMSKFHLDDMFKRYSDKQDSIRAFDILRMTQDKWEAFDIFGWCADKLEWLFLIVLLADKNWRIRREDIEAQYDGSLFYKLEQRHKASKGV